MKKFFNYIDETIPKYYKDEMLHCHLNEFRRKVAKILIQNIKIKLYF